MKGRKTAPRVHRMPRRRDRRTKPKPVETVREAEQLIKRRGWTLHERVCEGGRTRYNCTTRGGAVRTVTALAALY